MKDKNKGNTVSKQSKSWMENALIELMKTYKYEEITIQQLTDQAGLSRRTFYRNYSSKDEILEDCFKKIWSEYELFTRQQKDLSLTNVARIFFTVMKKHVDFLNLVNQQGLLNIFILKMGNLLPEVFNELKGKDMPFSKENIEYALTFSTGGFMLLLTRWLKDIPQKSPEEMAEIMGDIIFIANYQNPIKHSI